MRPRYVLLVALAAIGCAPRPDGLARDERLDSECPQGTQAHVYSTSADVKFVRKAVKSGCQAPIGAWTEPGDATAAGTRKIVFDLRTNDQKTLLCCN